MNKQNRNTLQSNETKDQGFEEDELSDHHAEERGQVSYR